MLSWTRWAMWKHIIFAILGTLVVAGGLSACDPIVPDVVGQALPDAIQRLENSGYSQLRVIDDSGATITRTHYEDGYKVTTQDKSGSDIPTTTTITLTVTESHITSLMSTPSTTPSSSPLPTHSPSYTPHGRPNKRAACASARRCTSPRCSRAQRGRRGRARILRKLSRGARSRSRTTLRG